MKVKTIRKARHNEITAIDLHEVVDGEYYIAEVTGSAQLAQAVWYDDIKRGAVAWGANATWTDADSVEDMFSRVIETGDIL